MRQPKAIWLFALLAALALVLAACGVEETAEPAPDDDAEEPDEPDVEEPDEPEEEPAEGFQLGLLPKSTAIPVFDIANEGAEEAAAELGHSITYVGPTDVDVSQQVEWIENLAAQEVAAIMISAIDPDATAPALREASERGIAAVSWDSDVAEDARSVFVSPPDFATIGQILAEMVGEQIDFEGQYAWLSTGPEVFNQATWIDEAEAFMEANPDRFGDMEMVRIAYGQDEDALSYSEAEGLLSAFPDLKGIVAPTTVGVAAAARAVQDADRCGEVAVTGLGTPNEMRAYVNDGCSEAFALWSFHDLGYLTVYATHAVLSGQIEGQPGETFDAGRLGEFEIGEDGVVALPEALVFDASNIDDFDF
jgi:rhamnose transport system substrate-binding protein